MAAGALFLETYAASVGLAVTQGFGKLACPKGFYDLREGIIDFLQSRFPPTKFWLFCRPMINLLDLGMMQTVSAKVP